MEELVSLLLSKRVVSDVMYIITLMEDCGHFSELPDLDQTLVASVVYTIIGECKKTEASSRITGEYKERCHLLTEAYYILRLNGHPEVNTLIPIDVGPLAHLYYAILNYRTSLWLDRGHSMDSSSLYHNMLGRIIIDVAQYYAKNPGAWESIYQEKKTIAEILATDQLADDVASQEVEKKGCSCMECQRPTIKYDDGLDYCDKCDLMFEVA